jgi:hypothetical protein
MAGPRHHSDILIAGLLQIGIIGSLGGAAQEMFPDVARALIWMPPAFIGGVVARRAIANISVGQLAIAVAVTVATLLGVLYQRDSRPMDGELAGDVALTVAAAVGGGSLARWIPLPRAVVLGAAAGGAGMGALLTATFIASALGHEDGGWMMSIVYATCMLGTAFAIRLVDDLRTKHAVFGLAVLFAIVLAAQSDTEGNDAFTGLASGALLGLIVGAIGGAIGTRLKRRAERRPAAIPAMRANN